MGSATLVPVELYLSTAYRPDRDYVDGEVLERNLGEKQHSRLQTNISTWLHSRRRQLGICVFVEQRVQVKPTRFRVPDICVIAGPEPAGEIFVEPPFLCIEILSRDDRMTEMQDRINDYLEMGVPFVWLINPQSSRAWVYTRDAIREITDGMLRTQNPDLAVPLAEVVAAES